MYICDTVKPLNIYTMKATTISKIKAGEYFTFKPIENPTEKQVYVRGDYERSLKKYEYYKFADCCSYNYAKGDRIVYIDFEF